MPAPERPALTTGSAAPVTAGQIITATSVQRGPYRRPARRRPPQPGLRPVRRRPPQPGPRFPRSPAKSALLAGMLVGVIAVIGAVLAISGAIGSRTPGANSVNAATRTTSPLASAPAPAPAPRSPVDLEATARPCTPDTAGAAWLTCKSVLNTIQDDRRQKVDGLFGSQTYNAVIAFQRAHGLKQDGTVGPAGDEERPRSRPSRMRLFHRYDILVAVKQQPAGLWACQRLLAERIRPDLARGVGWRSGAAVDSAAESSVGLSWAVDRVISRLRALHLAGVS